MILTLHTSNTSHTIDIMYDCLHCVKSVSHIWIHELPEGFNNGRLAQEEDMFRRTTCVAATPGPFRTFLHGNPEIQTLTEVPYPLEEFGVVCTKTLGLEKGSKV